MVRLNTTKSQSRNLGKSRYLTDFFCILLNREITEEYLMDKKEI